ncbi:hypothetical protein HNR42_000834 [Deinobacterium chartae]|uniref:AAA domain-containing protein n=1 Tax=Deinobacterium chartae TaxID=521158 RepID=A0A841HVK4_9DEIO|nr:AAA family ATPase [Deinobacterium chartae]MBB6097417.1 hypothetical protein [Deinobacterium chartae]
MGALIWVNGPFGVGKTQTAFELHARLPGSVVCDPEELGFALFRVVPGARGGDFQDLPLWREFTRRTLEEVARHHPGPVIVPMTVVVPQYFQETVGALRARGLELHHFALLAPEAVILRRLRGRGDGAASWPARQLRRCLEALASPEFGMQLHTDGLGVEAVAERIALEAGLSLAARGPGGWPGTLRRLRVQWRHMRR